ncbi:MULTISPECIES: hypothetical protein [unclassified Methanoculleus]|uniref:hypothetical protein n=1 Tax=unclassified Methanoculleus TaxID=2619537 RepID=UPI0025D15FA4|nr:MULTISPECIES: hypothetical protein [unclassified Methanoculleus]MCK9318828.1 hypothetical protein [Methanoculleus sp.]MDD2254888.1 hypothetical protein [Methanoculleus sp.]MDD2787709.1 hypothetical protein [Methanoculleus sp.]MDD3217075.1 hypothetical protein [Methanoculleus sp.]MDD4313629.1 hypothetical protein [Methanoculleus sp.]
MKWVTLGLVLMLVSALVAPAVAAGGERYSYITVEDVTVQLEKADAVVTMNYTIDGGIGFLVLLLGKSDLKQKVLDILNFNNAEVQRLDLEHVEVRVKNVSSDYGQGSYWLPAHRFGVVVPSLTIITPQDVKHYEDVSDFPDGLGYFA